MSKNLKRLYRPSADIEQYEDEAYTKNPLLKYNICEIKERRHYTFLQRKATKDKVKLCGKPAVKLDNVLPVKKSHYINKLREYANKIPVPRMLYHTEKKILGFVPKRLRDMYPKIVKDYMADVHAEFNQIIKTYSLNKILVPPEGSSNGEADKGRYTNCERAPLPATANRKGRTSNYPTYLKNRQKLKMQLNLTHVFIRAILKHFELDFPQSFCDFAVYNIKEKIGKPFLIRNYSKNCSKLLNEKTEFIKKSWYPKIMTILKKNYKKHALTLSQWKRVLTVAKGLINRQLNVVKMRTIEDLIEVVMDREKIPMLSFELVCVQDRIMLEPGYEVVKQSFGHLVDEIVEIGSHLETPELQLDRFSFPTKDTELPISLNRKYVDEQKERLFTCLGVSYTPVLRYVENIQNKYYELYSDETSNDLDDFLSQRREFKEYFDRINFYHNYISTLRSEVNVEYFDVAVVSKIKAITTLRGISNALIRVVTMQVVLEHMKEQQEICNVFENIRMNALEIPRSTEQLLEGGKYILNAKTVQVHILHERVEESIKIGTELLELTELSPEHIQLQRNTINWLGEIKNVFDRNATLFETYRFHFEEHLAEVARKLRSDIAEIIPMMSVVNDMSEPAKFRDYYALLQNFVDQLIIFDDYVAWINKEEDLFQFPKSKYSDLEALKEFIVPFTALMKLCILWLRYYYVWMDGPFEYLEPKFVEETTDEFYNEFLKTQKYYRNKIRQDMMLNSICAFRGKIEDPDPENHPIPIKLCTKMIQWIRDFRPGVFIVGIMCNSALRPRHWKEMSEVVGFDITPDAGTSLRKIINYNIDDKLDSLEIISTGANKELQLQANLKLMMQEWSNVEFPMSFYKDTGITILSSLDDVQALLDDHIIKTLSMRGSAFVKPCEAEVRAWYEKLMRVNSTFDEWGKVQSNFLYLLPIFSSKDIVAQMPEEGRLFVHVDQTYRRYMATIIRQPNVMETAPAPGLLEALEAANKMLDDITNGVNNYLEKKRLFFARFFFLSNDEMLEILSETKNPLRVQPHLNKCFEGIDNLDFDAQLNVVAMNSMELENIPFVTTVSTSEAGGSVEKWLLGVEVQMLEAVRFKIAMSYLQYIDKNRSQWVLEWPQMVVLCVSQVFWAADVHNSLETRNQALIRNFFSDLTTNLNEIVALIRSKDITNLNRITIKSLIVIDVHAKDVVEELIEQKVHSEADFRWLAQLRYYFEGGKVLVRIINATVGYANEYLGNSDRLVITPLTDRCYRTLIGAYQLHLNGAPEGPAGTGKTETTKDLAKALAVQCKVFNCSDGLDFKAMGKFFKGLASCGAWACFDEFNRIELEVLSVVAQQILSIIQAVRAGLSKFVFEGTELNLNPACYVCITMNPGYAGRSELPDNLKVLFRSVAMMVPDYAMIGEISLYSYGFVNARNLSVKIVTTYRLCSEQLSSQNHYDYGMRAVKTVLSACGNIKKAFPDENEEILLLRSLLDVNLPKFLSFDVPLFEGIISDLFLGVQLPKPDYALITHAFNEVCEETNLQPKECFLTKVIQTFEMMIVRHGFMMVGEPMAGKSSTLKTLAAILGKLKKVGGNPYFEDVQMGIVNPKAITMGQLYGAFDPISYEWTDGIAAVIFRAFANDNSSDRKWLIFDGPVDAVWIENMNTVLDDNKKLCLTSGEVITMSNSMSMIFEVMDLAQASPATVSRCGMIYMEPVTLGWETFAESWLNQCDARWRTERDLVMEMLKWTIPSAIHFVRRNCRQLIHPGEFSVLRTTFDIFEMLIDGAINDNAEDYENYLIVWFEAALLYSLQWGIGGVLDADSREKFDAFQKNIWTGKSVEAPIPERLGQIEISTPLEGLLIDYFYVFNQKGAWKYWPEVVRRTEPEESAAGIQVPTIDTGRYIHLLNMHIKNKKKMLLVGPTGTGKSSYMQNMLMNNLDPEEYVPAFITFTVMISANQTQNLFISKLVKRKRGYFGSPKGKTTVIFIDDMNMPEKEIYGAQPPLELLRQYFDYKHWYDLKDTSKIFLQDILVLCACGLPGGSRQQVYSRFLSHFNIFSINAFSEDTVSRIFAAVLLAGFRKGGHASDVVTSANQIVNATQQVYKIVSGGLRPTPAKSHYVFNVRDISRVCIGCSLMRKETVDHRKMFARVWYHESLRVFYDKLIDETDQKWLFQVLNDAVRDQFKDKVESIFDNRLDENKQVTLEAVNKVVFGSFMDEDSAQDEKRYEEIDFNVYIQHAYKSLEEFNSTRRSKINIVLFTYALQHLSKICRIMSMQGGSALLVGIAGSGRQSLTKLATTMCGEKLFQPEITKNYSVNDWHDDIKKVLKEAGGQGKHTAFLMTENQIKMELFLQDIDCLLNQGEVPNIFAIDERQEILEMVRLAAQGGNRSIDVSPLQVFSFFVNRCKQKLHIILCFSPIGSALRTRIRLYPSLVNCCTVDWFQIWPQEALQMVAERYMTKIEVSAEVKQAAIVACEHFHITANVITKDFFEQTGRIIYITSASFLDLIKSFESLVMKKQKEIMSAKMRYVGGLDTLEKASAAIEIMSTELSSLQPKLEILAENSKKMMIEINKETVLAATATEQVKNDEAVANIQAKASEALKEECQKDLAAVEPILEEALKALDTIKAPDITLLKSMTNPPPAVKLVMAAVCVIKGIPADRVKEPGTGKMVNDYWGPSKRLMADIGFMGSLKNFDKDNIKPEIIDKIRKEYISHKDFKPQIVAKASSAAQGMCKWIIAMSLYEEAAKIVAPKKAKLMAAEKEYSDTMALLTEKRNMLKALEEKVARLNEELAKANAQMQKTSDEVELCKNKLFRAKALIGGLGGEKSRWTQAATNLQSLYEFIPGNILISCGVIAYLAALTAPFRNKCIDDWFAKCKALRIPCSDEYNFANILGSDIAIQSWNISGLPSDAFSSENAVIMDSSSRYSLFIDPQGQANKWIKNMEKGNRLQVVKFSQPNYMKIIENCIEMGQPVLVENIREELEVPLDPILNHNTFIQGGKEFISLGDNVIEVSSKFKLYLTSNLRNPHYLPETFNKVTVINFALTQKGLEDQLLGIVVAKERPELQELRQVLITENAQNRALLKKAEDKILETLSSSEGDVLENEKAIQILDDSKDLAADIKIKQATSKETEIKIETFRQSYKAVAARSSVLYYTITDLPNIDPMYQFSLNWYINLYIYSIENANKSRDLQRRLKFLTDAVTSNLYNNVCRSIFEKDKLLYSFILATKIMLSTDQIKQDEFLYLLAGGSALSNQPNNPDTTWITDTMWAEICKLDELPHFANFQQTFRLNLRPWRKFYDSSTPHKEKLPAPWDQTATPFQKIIILKAFCPDKVFLAITDFVSNEMGVQYVSPPPFDIAKSFEDSNFLSPLIFILSPGADPMGSLLLFAERMAYDETFQSISLGQGQGPIAQRMIEEAQAQGTWVCLQNCHLAASWMPNLEYLWENMDIFNTQSTFRLWLTSYPSERFPVSLLQNGVKMTNEPPTGLQQNLLRSYNSEPMNDEKFYTGCPNKDRAFTRLLYAICFFHAIVQERRKFGPLGWNIPYGFNESDFQISVQQLQMFMNQYDDIQYAAISYLTAECNYGGRVTDAWDRRAIVTILADFVNESVVNDLRYSFAPGDEYVLPRKSEHREVVRYIEENIPPMPSPEVYGLHPNAGITRDLQTSTLLLDSMILTLGKVSTASGVESELGLSETLQTIRDGLPPNFDLDTVKSVYPVDYNESMNTVLMQEMERFNKLLSVVRSSCVDLQNGVKGIIAMTPELEDISYSIGLKKIPNKWMRSSYPSLKPLGSYVQDFIQRLLWLQKWFECGKPPTFWLSGFFFTQAFLTGAMQNFARKYKIPIDTLTFDFQVLDVKSLDVKPEDGVYVNGLFIEGAKWKGRLDEQDPKVLVEDIPAIHFKPVLVIKLQERGRYKCPLYKTAERRGTLSTTGHSTNYVLPLLLETQKPAAHWVKRSAALICQTSV